MERFQWDDPLNTLQLAFDTHIGRYIIATLALLSLVCWLLSGANASLRKLAAVAVGGSVALMMLVLAGHFFAAGALPPGAMP